ncbi:MAG: DUF2812 domain-containing protein [Sarcina sp.]
MKTKYEICKFYPFEYEGIEGYLGEKALQGWKLVSMYGTYMKFKRIEKEELFYSTELIKGSMIKGQNSEEALKIREKYKNDDWNFVCEWDCVQIFCSKSNVKPVYTDEELKFKKIVRKSTKAIILMILLCLLILFNATSGFIINLNPYTITSNLSVVVFVVAIGFIINIGIDSIRYISFLIKGRRSLKVNEKVNYSSSKKIKRKRIIDRIFFLIYTISLILILIDSKVIGLMVLSIMGISMLIVYGAWKWTGKEDVKSKKTIMITANVVAVIFIVVGLMTTIFSDIGYNDNKLITTNLSSEDFGIPIDKEYLFKEESKGILGRYINYSDNIVDYEILESKYEWIIDFYFNRKLKEFEKFNAKLELRIISMEDEYRGFRINNENYYIIKTLNKVITFRSINEIGEEIIIPLIDERLLESENSFKI